MSKSEDLAMIKDEYSKSLTQHDLDPIVTDDGEIELDRAINNGIDKNIAILCRLTSLYEPGINKKEHIFQQRLKE